MDGKMYQMKCNRSTISAKHGTWQGKIICFGMLLFLFALIFGLPATASLWEPESGFVPEDGRRVVPNNAAPPERTMPKYILPSLPPEQEGTIRSVFMREKVISLTFDLCELATVTTGYDAAVIDFLRQRKIPATLFLGGKWMRSHSVRAMQLMADPLFEIGNHAWSHGNFGIMDERSMLEQVRWTQAEYELLREAILERAARENRTVSIPETMRLFRLPYGRCSDRALALLAREGLEVVQWNVAAETSADNAIPGLGKVVADQVTPGSILLFHANRVPRGTAALLRETVDILSRRGYRFVTVGELIQLGEPQRVRNGYFTIPGDNLELDYRFGPDGTGRR